MCKIGMSLEYSPNSKIHVCRCREHCNALAQLRASLVYEPALSTVQAEAADLSAAAAAAAAERRQVHNSHLP